jgi:hypothetical protein
LVNGITRWKEAGVQRLRETTYRELIVDEVEDWRLTRIDRRMTERMGMWNEEVDEVEVDWQTKGKKGAITGSG